MKRHITYTAAIFIALLICSSGLYGQAKGSFEVYPVAAVSSGSDEMAPVILSDGILFCSNRKANPFLTKKNLEGVRLYELYFAPFDENGEPGKPERFASNLGKDINIGPASVSSDGKILYFTRNYIVDRKPRKDEANKLGIFTATRNGSQWTDIQPFEYNNPASNFSYPYVSADGMYLFFCSDMPGTMGKYDIYVCENVEGKWTSPVNLGDKVNSADAEINPFLHSSGRLYL
jgi:ribosomal protein L24E